MSFDSNRPKANWIHTLDIGDKLQVSVSDKNAVKLSTQGGKYMFCTQIDQIAELIPVLQAFIETEEYKTALKSKQESRYKKDYDKAMTREALKAQAAIEALQRMGVDVNAILNTKKVA